MDAATKYDTLARFESLFTKQKKTYAVHKKLQFKSKEAFQGINDINDWLVKNFPLSEGTLLLDAGCGTGKTLFTYIKQYQVNGVGVSLSKNEIALAGKAAEELNMTGHCRFTVQSYDDPLAGKFNQIIAIESLKHSKNLEFSIKNLASSLTNGGLIIIVEDLRARILPNKFFRNLLLKNWSLLDMYSYEDYCFSAEKSGLCLTNEIDFTHLVKTRKAWWSFLLVYLFGLLKFLIPFTLTQKILAIFQAGFALEYFYNKGFMNYKVLVFGNE